MSASTQSEDRRVLVVDDEPPARRRLIAMLDKLSGFSVCAEATNGDEAISTCLEQQPDIVLMDIRMPGRDGLQAAAAIAEQASPPAVIFCTAYDEHALAAINTGAMAYLLKPIKREPLENALNKTQKLNRAQMTQLEQALTNQDSEAGSSADAVLWVNTRQGKERLDISDVRAFVADNKYVSAYVEDREVIVEESLKTLEQQFQGLLLRIHRNALVNPAHVVSLDKPDKDSDSHRVRLDSVQVAPQVSRRLLPELRRALKTTQQ